MSVFCWFRALPVIGALVAFSVVAFVPQARSAPLPGGATASGGVVPQSPNCSAGREEDEGCVPRGPGSPTSPGGPVLPPVTPPAPPSVTPPITPPVGPLVLPPGIPPEDLHTVIFGRAKARLHIHDDNQDVTYVSNDVYLAFLKHPVQDMPGNTQYVLFPSGAGGIMRRGGELTTMTWTVTGRVFDCTVEGEAIITFPIDQEPNPNIQGGGTLVDPRRDPTRLAYGYINVVGPDGGDFHSVMVKAFDPDAMLTKTCPGNPPIVTKEPFGAGYLLHILWEKNIHKEDGINVNGKLKDLTIFKGKQSHDQDDPFDFLKLLPPGATLPDFVLQALSQTSGTGTSHRYIWEWELWRPEP